MSSPEYQPVMPSAAPPVVTPADGPSDPAGYASVTPHGVGPAPYSITAPLDDLAGAFDAAGVSAAGISSYSTQGPRQAQAEHLLMSPQGFSAGGGTSGYDVTPGYSGSSDDPMNGWPNNPQPVLYDTPVQGQANSFPQGQTGTD